ncbi:4Fe-4S dicluster domain-containing protein [Sulfurospirillum halorespirans]|nr:4Fe-4S dicluster domain-containing protein [Sulfurospirillum halorespirans]
MLGQSLREKKMNFNRRKFLIYSAEAGAMFGLVGAVPLMSGEHHYLRPPGAIKDDTFYKACIKCGACVSACPTKAVTLIDLCWDVKNIGTPIIDIKNGGCIAWGKECLLCVKACPTDVLSVVKDLKEEKLGLAIIKEEECVNCMVCFLHCPIEGVVLFPNPEVPDKPYTKERDIPTKIKLKDSPLKPYIVKDKCIGCGLCAHYCPPRCIDMIPIADVKKVAKNESN